MRKILTNLIGKGKSLINRLIAVVLVSSVLLPNANIARADRRIDNSTQSNWSTAKKVLVPTAIIGAGALVAYLIYNCSQKEKTEPDKKQDDKQNVGENNSAKEEKSDAQMVVENIKEALSMVCDKYELSYILYKCVIYIAKFGDVCEKDIDSLNKRISAIMPEKFASEKVECSREIINLVTEYLESHPNVFVVCITESGWLERERIRGNVQRYCQSMQEREEAAKQWEEAARLETERKKREKEEKERLEQELREPEKKKERAKERAARMSELKSKHDDFVAKFIKYIEDGTDFDENPPKQWVEDLIPREEERHKRLVECIKKSPNKDLCEKLYAELSWICYVLKEFDDDGGDFRFNSGLGWMIRVFGCFDSSKEISERRDYDEFWADDIQFGYFADDVVAFYKYDNIHFDREFCYYLERMWYINFIGGSKGSLKCLNSNISAFQGIKTRLARLKNCDDPTMKILVEGAQKLIVEPFEKELSEEKERLEKEKSEKNKETKSFDKAQGRYVPYGKKVGRGSFGSISVYWDTVENKKVAVKVLNGESFSEEKLKKMQKIDSPYVAKALDLVDVGNGKKGLVMEYVHGGEFMVPAVQRITDKNKLLGICIQLAKAFEAFHNAKLSHSDLTHYGNILLDDEGNVKIIDYDGAGSNRSIFDNCDPVFFNIIPALEQIGTVLVSTDEELFKSFYEKFGAKFEVKRYTQKPIFAELKSYYSSRMNFDHLIKTLEDMKKECAVSVSPESKSGDTAAA